MAAMSVPRDRLPGQPVGYFGKLPARADFIGRRLSRSTVECWDSWLQQCLARSQAALLATWTDRYLTAPVWRFVLPGGVFGDNGLAGVLVPSGDAVGRCFPLLLALELPAAADTVAVAAGGAAWFEAVETLALEALDEVFELAALDRALPGLECPHLPHAARGTAILNPISRWIPLPMLSALGAVLRETAGIGARPALWWTGGGAGFRPGVAVTAGMMAPARFAALLDGAWARHGWRGGPGTAVADGEPAWDRDS
ncbi:MAG TPA: type VI secretion system-associated protein TagF [Acetobacteraceae bacterium]|nr:type VI secretion system-associated protein TagF [Acetobacteraceae bacterium]